jgi:RNase P subunit RPR2
MYNKQSCRECGSPLVPHSLCNICNEHSSWVCGQCGRIEDYDHVSCRRQVVVAKS